MSLTNSNHSQHILAKRSLPANVIELIEGPVEGGVLIQNQQKKEHGQHEVWLPGPANQPPFM